jgi:hypothetical protein
MMVNHSTEDIKRAHQGHWFDANTMRFFSSRVYEDAYRTEDGRYSFFVTSEQNKWVDGPRLYSVRIYDWNQDNIGTVGEFQGYDNLITAKKDAKYFALNPGEVST